MSEAVQLAIVTGVFALLQLILAKVLGRKSDALRDDVQAVHRIVNGQAEALRGEVQTLHEERARLLAENATLRARGLE